MKKLLLVTGNKPKAREIERIIQIPIEIVDVEIDEIQGLDPEKIVLHKVNEAFKIVGRPVIVDDVSFEVEAWNGFPGPLIKWLLEDKNDPTLMLKMLGNEKNRNAIAKLYLGYHDGKKPHIFTGEVRGKITNEARGDNGFGWDRVFIPEGYDHTFAEMDSKIVEQNVKDKISHRRKALDKLKEFLDSQS